MTTTIHVVNNHGNLLKCMLENNPDSSWFIFNDKNSEYYQYIPSCYTDNAKKITTDVMKYPNGILYSISKNAYFCTAYIEIDIEKYFEAIKCDSIPKQFKQLICETFTSSNNECYEYIISDWMTQEMRDTWHC